MKKYFFFPFFIIIATIISSTQAFAQGCPCSLDQVELEVSRSTVRPGDSITFTVNYRSEGTNCVEDTLGGAINCNDGLICDPDSHICYIRLGPDNPSHSTTCSAPTDEGTHTFTHYWQRSDSCPCEYSPCYVSVNYTVDADAPPPGTPEGLLCDANTGIETAIGCIPVNDTTAFAGFLLRWGMGIGGGIAFILIIVAGFQIITSGGFPDKVAAGKQLLTAAVAGLFLIIFSVFILELFGVRILRLPGF